MTNAKDAYTKVFLRAANLETDQETLNKYNVVWWWNFRQKETGGLRLTEHALQFIEEHAKIKTYKVEFPKDFAITPQVLIWLDQFIDSPFFITKKYIIVMKEKAAFELYLFSGDIRKIGYNKALSKRLSQESLPE
jgi:hypothetical protein|tara:strand:+ start:6243 stop:6647 length:405 start_codon:yes stop_codon:yes gene_type:complete